MEELYLNFWVIFNCQEVFFWSCLVSCKHSFVLFYTLFHICRALDAVCHRLFYHICPHNFLLHVWIYKFQQTCRRGILVKLVICVSSGQLKIKIANLMQYAILAYFLPFSNTLSLENMIGNLIAPLTKLLYHIIGNSMSRGDLQNIMQWVWQDKSICLPQMNCQRLHIDGKKYSRNQSCHFFKNLQHVTFVHTDTIAAFISSGQCLENLFFHFKW